MSFLRFFCGCCVKNTVDGRKKLTLNEVPYKDISSPSSDEGDPPPKQKGIFEIEDIKSTEGDGNPLDENLTNMWKQTF